MLSPEERRRLRADLGRELKSKLAGRAAGYWTAEITAGTELTVPWQQLLARFVSGLRRSDYRLFPPNKKHLWRGLYMPTLGVPGPTHLVVAIDTSGSMSNKELAAVFGEIDALRAGFECKITVVQCDAVIQHVQEHDPWDDLVPPSLSGTRHRVYGRGGTDLRVPFAWLDGRLDAGTEHPDALIYCTDGYGPFPSREPDTYPVLWILTAGGVSDVPFGDVLRLPV